MRRIKRGPRPNFRPRMSHQFDMTVQRQINSKTTVDLAYIGRKYNHDLQAININAGLT